MMTQLDVESRAATGKLLTKIAFYVAMAALLIYFLVSRGPDLQANVSKRDSIAYWAAARLLLQHQSPYDAATVLQLEREQGYTEAKPLVLRTPPWSLFMVFPLGVLSAFWAWVAWVGLSLAALIVSLRLCWKLYGGDVRPPGFFWLVGYMFAPVPACLVAGQIGLVLLLGVALFMWLEPRRPFLAGAALILPFAKPHLLALVWVTLAFRALGKKHWVVVGGFITALVTASAIALAFDPAAFQHYREMLRQSAIGSEFIPALGGVLRLLFFHRFFWVQFIPLAVALIWGAWFYRRHHSQWQWRLHGLALLIVSVLTTPYAWLTDEVVLLPAILPVALWAYNARERFTWRTSMAVSVFACLNGLLLLILWAKIPFSTGIYFWSSLVWFGWYFYGRKFWTLEAHNQLR